VASSMALCPTQLKTLSRHAGSALAKRCSSGLQNHRSDEGKPPCRVAKTLRLLTIHSGDKLVRNRGVSTREKSPSGETPKSDESRTAGIDKIISASTTPETEVRAPLISRRCLFLGRQSLWPRHRWPKNSPQSTRHSHAAYQLGSG